MISYIFHVCFLTDFSFLYGVLVSVIYEKKRTMQTNYNHFITFPDEKIILASRQHKFLLILPVTVIVLVSVLSFVLLITLKTSGLFSFPVFISLFMLVVILMNAAVIKLLSDWYYHFYVVTSRKIVEVSCNPLFSRVISGLLLEQVRVTEVDVEVNGLINDIFNMGHVIIDFDRMAHEERFTLYNIERPHETSRLLAHSFELIMQHGTLNKNQFKAKNLFKASKLARRVRVFN